MTSGVIVDKQLVSEILIKGPSSVPPALWCHFDENVKREIASIHLLEVPPAGFDERGRVLLIFLQ